MRTTLKHIAEATNLSVTIVCQVLNGTKCRISDEKRQLILDTAKAMNYRPNHLAVSLVKGSANMIGLAISDIRNDFFSVLAKGAENECQKNNWNLMLCNSNDQHDQDIENLKMLADKGVSGIIFGMASETTPEMAQECIDFLNREKIPYILVDRYVDSCDGAVISTDNEAGGYRATRYLLETGHRNIVCITGPSNLLDSQQRLEGYKRAIRDAGIEPDDKKIVEGRYTYQSGLEAADRMTRQGILPDAIFACNDMMAIGAMKRLREKGYRIPEDISVIGYDDIFMDEFLEVPLTTIRQPTEAMGQAAAEHLIGMQTGRERKNDRIVFQPELVIRQTVISR